MNLVMLHGPEDLRVEEVEPDPLEDESVRVDIAYTGICGSDLHEYKIGPVPIRAEDQNHSLPESEWDEVLPKPMGHEISGIVSEVGDGVEQVIVGDEVALNMRASCGNCRYCAEGQYHLCVESEGGLVSAPGFADNIVVPESMVIKVPNSVSLREAALTEPMSVALRGVHRSGLQAGDSVAVFGAGPIGLGIVNVANASGAGKIYVSEPRKSRRKAAEKLGADETFDPTETNPRSEIRERTDGVDISFETAGIRQTLTDALRTTKYGGTTVVLSVFEEETELHPNDIMQGERTVIGSYGFNGGPVLPWSEYAKTLELMDRGKLQPSEMITKTIDIDKIDAGFRELLEQDTDQIKILVQP